MSGISLNGYMSRVEESRNGETPSTARTEFKGVLGRKTVTWLPAGDETAGNDRAAKAMRSFSEALKKA